MKFHQWLLETGRRRELDSLIPPAVSLMNHSESKQGQAADAEHSRTGESAMASSLP